MKKAISLDCLLVLLVAIHVGLGLNIQLHSETRRHPSVIFMCTFEEGTCLIQSTSDQFKWTRHHGTTESDGTGPSGDHTSGNGFYFYTESSIPRKAGDKAVAQTPTLSLTHNAYCLTFWYHMLGEDIGTLMVSGHSKNKVVQLMNISGNQGTEWKMANNTLPNETEHVKFTGVVGPSFSSDIAIDDIMITKGACDTFESLLIECNFDQSSCSDFFIQSSYDDFDWTRLHGSTPSFGTGPTADHTTGTGYYMYIEASIPRAPWQEARLIMKTDQNPGTKCLRFWYHMRGDGMGSLVVKGLASSGSQTLFRVSGSLEDIWRKEEITIVTGILEAQFIGIIGNDYRGDIALDDISLTSGTCEVNDSKVSGKERSTPAPTSTKALPTTPTGVYPTQFPPGSDLILSGSIVPEHYDLHMAPDIYGPRPSNFSFRGSVNIRVHVRDKTNVVSLHMLRLNVSLDIVKVADLLNGHTVPVRGLEVEEEKELLHIHLEHSLRKGSRYRVHLEFQGKLFNRHYGLFYDVHYSEAGHRHYAVVSQFETTFARTVFPCFDEPKYKATFTVTILRKSHMTALSNEALVKTEIKANGWVADTFKTTLKMSTYLLNIFVGNYSSITTKTNTGIPISIWTPNDVLSTTEIYLATFKKGMETLIDYLEQPYRMSKFDIVSINNFFPALENWGLINIRGYNLFYKREKTTTSQYQRSLNIHIHEMAHQWFGNLVTMRWWSDLWIKEGFATYLQVKILKLMYPAVDAEGLYLVHPYHGIHAIMIRDSLNDTSPLHLPNLYSSSQIEEAFNSLQYHKGAAFLRMINYLLGDINFQQALRNYLKLHAFSTVTKDEVISVFQTEAKKAELDLDLLHLMTPWLTQPGYPVVHATWTPGNRTLTLRQERFIKNIAMNTHSSRETWNIPISFINSVNTSWDGRFIWMQNEQMVLNSLTGEALWYLLNINQSMYYRVNYDQTSWMQLSQQLLLDHRVFPVYNRAQLINDAAELVEADMLQFSTLLTLIKYIPQEDNYVVLTSIDEVLYPISQKLVLTPIYDDWQEFIRRFIRKSYLEMRNRTKELNSLDWKLKKDLVTTIACEMDLDECVSDVGIEFDNWMSNPHSIPYHPDIKSVALCAAIRTGIRKRWYFMSEYLLNNATSEDFDVLVEALGCTHHVRFIYKLLQMSLNPPKNKKYIFRSAMAVLASNRIGHYFGWSWFKEHWKTYVKILGFANVGRDLSAYAKTKYTKVHLRDMECFLTQIPKTENLPGSNNAPASIQRNIEWNKKNYRHLEQWMVHVL